MRQYPRLAIWSIIAVIGAGYAVVDENVDFFEKHAPKINAAIHDGEITSTGDASYDMQKWIDDRAKLDADLKSDDWSAMRQEMLKRKPAVDDLILQNGKIQRRVKLEADSHLDVNDACEGLTIKEGAPLIAQDTQTRQEFYALVERTTTVTPEVAARIDKLIDLQATINKRFVEFNDHWQAKCK
jgi:hypothetical protein